MSEDNCEECQRKRRAAALVGAIAGVALGSVVVFYVTKKRSA